MTESEKLYQKYWTAFTCYLSDKKSELEFQQPSKKFSLSIRLGTSCRLAAVISKRDKSIRAELVLESQHANSRFDQLFQQQSRIHDHLGYELTWEPKPDKMDAVIYIKNMGADPNIETDWVRQFAWLEERISELSKVFTPEVQFLA